MTSPRWKEWLFDEDKFTDLLEKALSNTDQDNETPIRNLEEFFESEIKRNIREFSVRIRQENLAKQRQVSPSYWLGVDAMNEKIDAALKEYE